MEYICNCEEVNVKAKEINREINLEIGCINCGRIHQTKLDMHTIFKDNNIIYCSCGSKLLFLGDKERGRQLFVGNNIDRVTSKDESSKEEYFKNFKVLAKTLAILYNLNKEKKIGCDCGNSILNIVVFSDRIEIKCLACSSVKLIFAETEEDLSVLQKKDKIMLKAYNISCIDSINEKNRNIKK